MNPLAAIVELAADDVYFGPLYVELTPAVYVAWMLWRLGA